MRWVAIVFIVLCIAKLTVHAAEADHQVFLPGLPTQLINSIKSTQTVKWCANSAAHNYPNFIAQINDVQAGYTNRVGIQFEKVNFGTLSSTGCQLQHNMQEFSCSGCAAHIYYANWPVVVEYKPSLGYSDWSSAIGHELGHGLLGLHEQYIDSGGSIGCTYRADTVMSCGPPYVKYPQPRDVTYGCQVINTSWCAQQPDPEPIVYPYWDGSKWVICAACEWMYFVPGDQWYDSNGNPEWDAKVDVYYPDGRYAGYQQWNRRLQERYFVGQTVWSDKGYGWECREFCF